MKSIFEIQDGDTLEAAYAIPGYHLALHVIQEGLGATRMEVHDQLGYHEHLTSRLERFDGHSRNRDTMIKIGMWLQREAARIGVPKDVPVSVTLPNPFSIQVQFTESAADRVRRACTELGWTLESAKANVFEDVLEVSGVTRTGERFEGRLSGRQCRGDLLALCDALECPLCGKPNEKHHRLADGERARTVCPSCYAFCTRQASLGCVLKSIGSLAAIHAWPTPVRDMVDARIAEQVYAGGVDCDATRASAERQVRLEAAMAELVCDHVRLVHDPKLRWYGMAPKDLAAVAARQLKCAVTAGVLELPPDIEIVHVVAKPLERIEFNVKFADAPGETP